jgi:xylulokinase
MIRPAKAGRPANGPRDTKPVILAIDSGTSSCKVVAVDADGEVISETSAPHTLIQSRPGWAEQNAEAWWEAVADAVTTISEQIRRRVACLTVTSQREGFVAVERSGKPLADCIIWLDRRAEPELRTIEEHISERELFLITGLRLDATFSLPRLLWLRRHEPELIERAACFLQPADFLLARLTGAFVSDLSFASRTALLDVKNRRWSQRLLDSFQIDAGVLPDLVEPGEELGAISPAAAEALGLPRMAKVFAGAGDQQAMALGAGAFEPGTAAISMGTSTSIVILTQRPVFDDQMRVLCNCSALPGGWDLQAPIWTTGALIDWLEGFSGEDKTRLIAAALDLNPGADGLIASPHFAGAGAPHWRPHARGALLGLSLGHGPAHAARAILEAIAYEIRDNLAVGSELTAPLRQVTLTGGLARDHEVLGLFASILGTPVTTVDASSTAALGVYANVAVQNGFTKDHAEALAAIHESRRTVEPEPELAGVYSALYASRSEQLIQLLETRPASVEPLGPPHGGQDVALGRDHAS